MSSDEILIKRVAAINDLSGYGKCSLSVVIPLMSAFGIEVCPVPTAIFSTHTIFEHFKKIDLTPFLDDFVASWKYEGLKFDAIYSGYLIEKTQVFNVLQLYADNPHSLKIVDPVLGDNGRIYDPDCSDVYEYYPKLISLADYITPNLTEACFLTNTPYSEDYNDEFIFNICRKVKSFGVKNVILTGIVQNNCIYNFCLEENNRTFKIKGEYFNYQIHGAGDLFSACLTSCLILGKSLTEAVNIASRFVSDAVEITLKQPGFEDRGVSFEPLLCDTKSYLNNF